MRHHSLGLSQHSTGTLVGWISEPFFVFFLSLSKLGFPQRRLSENKSSRDWMDRDGGRNEKSTSHTLQPGQAPIPYEKMAHADK